jgi:hypothetical protein
MEREHLEIKAKVHETCVYCGHTHYDKWIVEAYAELAIRNKIEEPYLTYVKSTRLVPKADDPN